MIEDTSMLHRTSFECKGEKGSKALNDCLKDFVDLQINGPKPGTLVYIYVR